MDEQGVKLIIGGLLHDVGKVIYRTGDGRKHSKSGYDYLCGEIGINDREVLDSVLFHHTDALRNASIEPDSNAYITYIADNIASAADRRKTLLEDYGFEVSAPLQPVFNILNGNKQNMYYQPMMLEKEINYPVEEKKAFDEYFYCKVKKQLTDALKGISWTKQYINSVLEVIEATMSYIPSSTAKSELMDISLFDHLKLTAAVNSCIYQYLKAEQIKNYKEELFDNEKAFYGQKVFLLYSIDVSGIQKFIYTIRSKDALRTLRARSFYLEFLMEHMIDSILDALELSRANLIYSGGGHCYILLPNTSNVKSFLDRYEQEVNTWLQSQFDTALYVATGYMEASANALKNVSEKSYSELYRNLSNCISEKKAHRYSAKEIIELNNKGAKDYTRECTACKKLADVSEDGLCAFCENLKEISKGILYAPFFVVIKDEEEKALPLPGGCFLVPETADGIRKRMKQEDSFVRAYAINEFYTGENIATKIWIGNYTEGQTFEELSEASEGIKRLGVLRADVDNLGQAFVQGFEEQYNTLSRTAAFSRHLSLFFKYYINGLLENGRFGIYGNGEKKKRNATVIYSGGDDLFLVGAWNEVIELMLDIRNAFNRYTEGTLTISGGMKTYTAHYPISRMAVETGELEDASKKLPGKDAVTLFPDGEKHEVDGLQVSDGTYSWNEFEKEVLGEKYSVLEKFFASNSERGMNFLYNLLELIRGWEEKINFARYVYILSRMEPDKEASEKEKKAYKEFAKQMYQWIKKERDCRQLKTAMNLYSYLKRNVEEKGEAE